MKEDSTKKLIEQYRIASKMDIQDDSNSEAYQNQVKTIDSYCESLIRVNDSLFLFSKKSLSDLVEEIVNDKKYYDINNPNYRDPMSEALDRYKELADKVNIVCDYQTAYKKFMQYHLGFYFANVRMKSCISDLELCKMVAATAIFASKEMVKKVKEHKEGSNDNICPNKIRIKNEYNKKGVNQFASWDFYTSARLKKKKGVPYNDVNQIECLADDNTSANRYIKTAIRHSYKKNNLNFHDYVACHIWDKPDDCRYYASIPNLVLVPSSLAGLTDNNEEVKKMLRVRASELFDFCPEEESVPTSKYSDKVIWRNI